MNLHASICLPEFTGLQSRMWLLLIILLIVVAMAAGWFSTSASISINSHSGRGEEPVDPVMEMTDTEAQSLDA